MIDSHLPEHQSPEQQPEGRHKPYANATALATAEPAPASTETTPDGDLYHHIDVQA